MGVMIREAWDNQWVMQDRAKTFTFDLYSDTDQAAYIYASGRSASISITYAGGGALPTPVADVALTWTTGSTLTYALAAANTANAGQAFRGVVKVVAAGATVAEYPFFFDVVPFVPSFSIIDADLTGIEPVLAGSTYKLLTAATFQAQIIEAYRQIVRDIRNMGVLSTDLLLDPQTIREAHLHKALEIICGALAKSTNAAEDTWYGKHLLYADRYARALAKLKDIRDRDASGHAESDTETVSPQPMWGWNSRG